MHLVIYEIWRCLKKYEYIHCLYNYKYTGTGLDMQEWLVSNRVADNRDRIHEMNDIQNLYTYGIFFLSFTKWIDNIKAMKLSYFVTWWTPHNSPCNTPYTDAHSNNQYDVTRSVTVMKMEWNTMLQKYDLHQITFIGIQ